MPERKEKLPHNPSTKKSVKRSRRAGPINTMCPVTGKPAVAGKVTVYKGQKIGLCCGGCKRKFEKNPAKYIANVTGLKKSNGKMANGMRPQSKGRQKKERPTSRPTSRPTRRR